MYIPSNPALIRLLRPKFWSWFQDKCLQHHSAVHRHSWDKEANVPPTFSLFWSIMKGGPRGNVGELRGKRLHNWRRPACFERLAYLSSGESQLNWNSPLLRLTKSLMACRPASILKSLHSQLDRTCYIGRHKGKRGRGPGGAFCLALCFTQGGRIQVIPLSESVLNQIASWDHLYSNSLVLLSRFAQWTDRGT